MRTTTPAALLLALGLAACGGSTDHKKAAYKAFADEDHAEAAQQFEQALASRSASDADYKELKIDRVRALSWVDGDRALVAARNLASELTLDAREYRDITTEMVNAHAYAPAVQMMDLGMKAFPDDEKMAQVRDVVIETSEQAGDPAALNALKGMGYLGGD